MKDVRAEAIPSSPLMRWWASWRLALRINRREAGRSKLRAAFIALTVGLPVLLATALSTFMASQHPSADAELRAWMGSADVLASPSNDTDGLRSADRSGQWTEVRHRVSDLLPGAQVTPVSGESVGVVNGGRWLDASMLAADLTREPARSMVYPISGRLPTRVGEVVVTPEVRRKVLGDRLQLRLNGRGYPAVVVGVVGAEHGVTAHPGTVPQTTVPEFLVTRLTPFSDAEIEQAGRAGLGLRSRHEVASDDWHPADYSSLQFGNVMAVALGAFEIALLTAPAFTIGALRARQSLAQFALNGAERKQVRRVVLGQAVLLGWLPALVGAALGVVSGWGAAAWHISRKAGLPSDRDASWSFVLAVVGCALLAALAGAAWPIRGNGRLEVAHLLRHQPPGDRIRRRVPVLALCVAGIFMLLQFLSVLWDWRDRDPSSDTWLRISLFFTIGAVISVMFVVPWVLAVLATATGRAPVAARVAARDVLRQRSRSVSAVSAIIAAFSVLATFSIAIAAEPKSDDSQTPWLPANWTQLYGLPDDPMAMAMVRSSMAGTTAVPVYNLAWNPNDVQVEIIRPPGVPESSGGASAKAISEIRAVRRQDMTRLPFTKAEQEVLRSGGIVNVPSRWIQQGRVTVGGGMPLRKVSAAASDGSSRLGELTFVLVETVRTWDLEVESAYYLLNGQLTDDQAHRLKEAFPDSFVPGPDTVSDTTVIMLVAGGLSLILAVFAAVSATVLSQAEQQQDLRTMQALGAPTRMTRRFGAAQAGLITATGAVLGLGIGVVPGVIYAALNRSIASERDLSGVVKARLLHAASCVPWGQLLLVGLLATLIAAGLGWLLAGERRSARQTTVVNRATIPAG